MMNCCSTVPPKLTVHVSVTIKTGCLVICFPHWTVSSLGAYLSSPLALPTVQLPTKPLWNDYIWLAHCLTEHRAFRELWAPEPLWGAVCKGRGIDCTKGSESRTLPHKWKQQLVEAQVWSEREHLLIAHTLGLGKYFRIRGCVSPFCQMSHPIRRSCFYFKWGKK